MDTPEWIAYQQQFDLSASHFQYIHKITDKHCVIVEPRCHSRLIIVIKNFMYLLQKRGYGLVVFHSKENEQLLKEGLQGWPNVIFIVISQGNFDVSQYNDLLCSPPFWRTLSNIGSKHALMFQIDTVLLKDSIDDFLEYDYIGAPWVVKWLGLDIGNGGLSLRNVMTMCMITEQCPRTIQTNRGEQFINNEDVYFSFYLKCSVPSVSVPSVETALKFSIETIFYDDPCGMHQPHIGRFPSYADFAKLLSKRYIEI